MNLQTFSALSSFTVHMLSHPDIQQKAQAEIDGVLGKSRLPTVDDQAAFPYVTAVLQETLRCTPVAALGLYYSTIYTGAYSLFTIV